MFFIHVENGYREWKIVPNILNWIMMNIQVSNINETYKHENRSKNMEKLVCTKSFSLFLSLLLTPWSSSFIDFMTNLTIPTLTLTLQENLICILLTISIIYHHSNKCASIKFINSIFLSHMKFDFHYIDTWRNQLKIKNSYNDFWNHFLLLIESLSSKWWEIKQNILKNHEWKISILYLLLRAYWAIYTLLMHLIIHKENIWDKKRTM